MMTVADQLLATVPLHQDPDDEVDEFKDWLRRHTLTRSDGRWLADRRDLRPVAGPISASREYREWRWSVTRDDLESGLWSEEGWINVWGNSTTTEEHYTERVRVRSCLVCPQRSAALLSSLQSVDNPFSYVLPSSDSDFEIDKAGYVLKAWVTDDNLPSALDEFDPWSGKIDYPSLAPAKLIDDLVEITPDKESRTWVTNICGEEKQVVRSQVWGCTVERHAHDDSESERGRRLLFEPSFTYGILRKLAMDMVAEVQIERKHYRGYHDEDSLRYVQPYTKLYLISSEGEISTL